MKDEQRLRVDARIAKARTTNAKRDKWDRRAGFAAPSQSPFAAYLATAAAAIEAGLHREDWDCVAEGHVMLEDLVQRARAAYQRNERWEDSTGGVR